MNPQISRREFLKLLGTTALTFAAASRSLAGGKGDGVDFKSNGPNVLILLFDSLTAEHMSLYGYQRRTTPKIADFAKQAMVYHNHYSSGNFTSPTTASQVISEQGYGGKRARSGKKNPPEDGGIVDHTHCPFWPPGPV